MMGMLDIHRIITTTLKKSCVYRKCLPTWQSWKASYNYTNIKNFTVIYYVLQIYKLY